MSTLNGYIEEMYSGHDVVRLSRANEQVKETFGGMNRRSVTTQTGAASSSPASCSP